MSKVTKSRARSPLIEGSMSLGFSNYGAAHLSDPRFTFMTFDADKPHSFTMHMNRVESVYAAVWIARKLTNISRQPWEHTDDRTASDCLRALADMLDAEPIEAGPAPWNS